MSAALTGSLDLATVLQTAIESTVEVLDLDTGAIYLLEGQTLRLGATTPPLPADFPEEFRYAPLADHPHISQCLTECDAVYLADTSVASLTDAERGVTEARGLRSLLYVPLSVEGESVGAMIVGSTAEKRAFDEVDADLCRTLSYEVSLAVANARLFASLQAANRELEHAYDDTLVGWSLALEMRDADTSGHTERVVGLTVECARALGVAEDQLPHVRRGALLHDIGKMTIPDAILRKPGPLDDDEWAIMQQHPARALEMLERIDYLVPALDIPYCHHERWDGSGYPRGLAGEDIPLVARIFAIIDVFDALISDRPYRRAWSRDRALEHIRAQSGRHFDPRVVDLFLQQVCATEDTPSSR